MTPDELLAITPELLARTILHRRERLAEVIPEQLDARQEELAAAEPLAKAAKEQRDSVNSKVAGLKKERNESQKEAKELFLKARELREKLESEGGIKNPNPKWAKEKLQEKLDAIEAELQTSAGTHKTEERYITEMKGLIREHEDWVAQREASQPDVEEMRAAQKRARELLDQAQKAHEAMASLVAENEIFHNRWVENEAHRRRADSRTKRLAQALDSSQRGIEQWQKHIDGGFSGLLEDMTRVKEGGQSTRAIAKAAKSTKKQDKSGGEEE